MNSTESDERRERTVEDVLWGRVQRKRDRIRAEIQRNRRGGHKIPTWVLAASLGAFLVLWIVVLLTSR